MSLNNRQGRAAAAILILLIVLALIAYGVYWYSQNQLPKLLQQQAKTQAMAEQPGAPGGASQSESGGAQAQTAAPEAQAPKPLTVELAVTGMTCDDCSQAIESELIKLPGVSTVSADWKAGSTKVQYDAAKVTNEQLVAAIEKLGYKATLKPDTAKAPATTG